MNVRRVRTVFVKELVDILRDHRTLIAMIVVPLVLYPLLMLGSIQAVTTQNIDIEKERITVGYAHRADWDDLVVELLLRDRAFLEQERAAAVARGDDHAKLAEIPTPVLDYINAHPTSRMDDDIREHQLTCGVEVVRPEPSERDPGPLKLIIHHQPEQIRSVLAYERLRNAFERARESLVDAKLRRLSVDPAIVTPFVVDEKRLSTPGSVLGLVLPLILVLMTITGAIYPAIDLTAGERERGTLESLMACPVPIIDLVVGKFLVITTVAIVGAALNLASVTATVYFGGLEQALSSDPQAMTGGFPFRALPIVLLSLVPFAVLMSAIMIAVCSIARTFKEAQNYVTPVILAVLIPGGMAALPGSKLGGLMLVTPVANMVLLTRDLLSGAIVPPASYAWVLISTCLYAATAVAVAAQVFGRESVVFSDSLSLRLMLDRTRFRAAERPTLMHVALYTAVLFPLWFYVQGLLQKVGDADLRTVLTGTAVAMPILFVAVPWSGLVFWKVSVRRSFSLRSVRGRFLLASLLLGISAWAPAHELFVFQDRYVTSPPSLAEMNKTLEAALGSMPAWLALLLVAVTPAVCEELFFRGFLLNGLHGFRTAAAVLASACVFAVFHFLIVKFTVTAFLGIVLGYLCVRSGSIFPGMLAHALHNGLAVAAVIWPNYPSRLGLASSGAWDHLPASTLMPVGAVFATALALIVWPAEPKRAPVEPAAEPANAVAQDLSNPLILKGPRGEH